MTGAWTRVLSVTSGKGGVGKSTVVANLACALQACGKRVLILDGDLGMANLDIMFGVRPSKDISYVLNGEGFLEEVVCPVDRQIDLIPGGSGIYELSHLSAEAKSILMAEVESLGRKYDYMLIDTAPGIDDHVLYLNSAAQEIIVVVTPDPASISDSYALIKVLNTRYHENRFKILCNQVKDEKEGFRLYQRLSDVASRFLCVSLDYLGTIPEDRELRAANQSQKLISRTNPGSLSSVSFLDIVKDLDGYREEKTAKGSIQFFWSQLLGVA